MQRDIFYTGVRDVECDFILKCAEYQQFYKDGGPYKVCEELMEDDRVEYLGIAHTTKAFRRIK